MAPPFLRRGRLLGEEVGMAKKKRLVGLTAYIAGPLFTQAERTWNAKLARWLRKLGYQVVLPQEAAENMLAEKASFDPQALFDNAVNGLEASDMVIAVLDGPDSDSGTAWECGYAWKLGLPIIGVRTDLRAGGDDISRPVNLMLARSCREFLIIAASTRTVQAVANQIHEVLQRVERR